MLSNDLLSLADFLRRYQVRALLYAVNSQFACTRYTSFLHTKAPSWSPPTWRKHPPSFLITSFHSNEQRQKKRSIMAKGKVVQRFELWSPVLLNKRVFSKTNVLTTTLYNLLVCWWCRRNKICTLITMENPVHSGFPSDPASDETY